MPADDEPAAPALADDESAVAPAVAKSATVRYLDPAAPWGEEIGAEPEGTRLQAFLAARVSLRYDDTKAGLDTTQEWEALYGPLDGGLDLDAETTVDYDERDFRDEPIRGGSAYVLPSAPLDKDAFFRDAARAIQRRVADTQSLELLRCAELDLYSRPGETREQFEARADEAAQAGADAETAKIRDRLEAKRDRLERALETARRRAEEAESEQSSRRSSELLSGVGSVIGVLLGGKANSRTIARAGRELGSAASRRGMTTRAGERQRTAEERVESAEEDLEALEQELLDEIAEIDDKWKAKADATRDGRDPARGDGRPRRRDDARLGADGLIRAVAAAATVLAVQVGCGGKTEPPTALAETRATVAFVVDGDTIELADGRRVRLVQVDAPELVGECYGPAARLVLRRLLPPGVRVRLIRDPALDDRDEHGRLLRYVEANGVDVNVELVRLGAAAPYFFRGARGRDAARLERTAQAAVRQRRGVWRACPQARLRPMRALAAGPPVA